MTILPVNAAALLAAAFLAVLFLQSGIDKVVDWAGNLDWLTGHFSKSPLANFVPLLLGIITVLELGSGVLNATGLIVMLLGHPPVVALWGATLSGVSLLALFFGQRMAKDYAGAAALVPYFILVLLDLIMLSPAAY